MRISTHEPVTQLRRVPIRECGEPLVDYLQMCPKLLVAKPYWNYTRATLLRKSVAEMLCRAADALPADYRIAVTEGWRPPHIQRRMYAAALRRWREAHPEWSELAIRRIANRFTAPPNVKVPPPHTTGGAVDLRLVAADGSELDMSAPFSRRSSLAYPFASKGLTAEARKLRQVLREALEPTGITNYPSEYWHWSYGDQGWAYRGGHEAAIYGPIEPPGYVPPEGDDTDEPLLTVE